MGERYRQNYTLDLDDSGAALIGSFVEPHAPAPPIAMRFVRGYAPVLPRRGSHVCAGGR